MPRPGPNVTSDADTQPGSDSLFPTGFSGGGALVRSGSVGTGEIADGSVAAADLNLASVAAAIAARSEMTGTYARMRQAYGRNRFTPGVVLGTPTAMTSPPTITTALTVAQIASSVQYTPTSNALTVLGPLVFDNGSGYYRPALVTGAAAARSPWTIAFDLYGSRFEIRYSTKGEAGELRIEVDGQYADPNCEALPNVNDGSDKYALVDFTTVATRRIRVEMTGGVSVKWIAVDPTAIITPVSQNGPTCLVVGDSYSLGYGVIGNSPSSVRGYVGRLRDMLGWGRLVVDGSPGTGYSHSTKYSTRLAGTVASLPASPDVVLVQGSVNDNSDGATLQSDAAAYLASITAQWPNAVVLATTTPTFPVSTGAANRAANDAKIAAAAASVGVPVVDISTPAVTGTGKAGATTGNGPADLLMSADGVHPTIQGHEFMARAIAARILALASATGAL